MQSFIQVHDICIYLATEAVTLLEVNSIGVVQHNLSYAKTKFRDSQERNLAFWTPKGILSMVVIVQAVYWQLDHALRINPLPHALVLADSAPAADYIEKKSGCVCINPVRLLLAGTPKLCHQNLSISSLQVHNSSLCCLDSSTKSYYVS